MVTIALEGGVSAGKTAVAASINRIAGATVIPEYMELLDEVVRSKFDQVNPHARLAILLDLEKRRTLRYQSSPLVVLDRCFLTLFAHDFAMRREGILDDTSYLDNYVGEPFLLPKLIIYLDVDSEKRVKRCNNRSSEVPEYLLRPSFNASLRRFFKRVSQHNPVAFVSTDQGSPDELAEYILHKLLEKTAVEDGQLSAEALSEILNDDRNFFRGPHC